MVFPVVMYGCESWTIKKAEHQRIEAFQLWCWRRLLRVPWTALRSNQSILKEISPFFFFFFFSNKQFYCIFLNSSSKNVTVKLTNIKMIVTNQDLKSKGKGIVQFLFVNLLT